MNEPMNNPLVKIIETIPDIVYELDAKILNRINTYCSKLQ